MKRLKNIILALVVIGVFGLVAVFTYYMVNTSKVSDDKTLKEITINAGSIDSIANTLKDNNLIKNVTIFKVYTRLNNKTNLKAGVYNLSEDMTVKDIVDILEEGSNVNPNEISITFKEGINIRKVASLISENTNNSYDDVLNKLKDKTYINSLISKYWFLTDDILSDGIYYYQFNGPISNFKYFFAVVFNKKHQFMHKCLYEDIEKLEVVAKKKYMSIGSPLAYETYVSDFKFTFKNGQTFYFYWPMILNDDARYIATIVEKKVEYIEDPYNILYAMKQGINLNDYLIGRL